MSRRRLGSVLLAAVTATSFLGCDLMDEIHVAVKLPVEQAVTLDLSTALSAVESEVGRPLPDPYPNNSEYPALKRDLDFEFPLQVDLAGMQSRIADSLLIGVQVRGVECELRDSTLPPGIERAAIYVSDYDKQQFTGNASATKFADLTFDADGCKAKFNAKYSREIEKTMLNDKRFTLIFRGRIRLDTEKEAKLPKGSATLNMKLRLLAVTQPAEAL